VPFLRYLPNSKRSVLAAQVRDERDQWLEELFIGVQEAVKNGTAKPCIVENLLNESGKTQLTMGDIQSINVSLVSGGFETVATTGLACLGLLASLEGQAIQDRAYEDLINSHGSVEDVWETSITDEKSPYVVALVREMLRYFAAIQFLPPRQTMKEFTWQGVRIPKGVTVIQNAQAINHGKFYILRFISFCRRSSILTPSYRQRFLRRRCRPLPARALAGRRKQRQSSPQSTLPLFIRSRLSCVPSYSFL
jgi:phenylacetate 2-hydroxylase